jgi:hypothetical protein
VWHGVCVCVCVCVCVRVFIFRSCYFKNHSAFSSQQPQMALRKKIFLKSQSLAHTLLQTDGKAGDRARDVFLSSHVTKLSPDMSDHLLDSAGRYMSCNMYSCKHVLSVSLSLSGSDVGSKVVPWAECLGGKVLDDDDASVKEFYWAHAHSRRHICSVKGAIYPHTAILHVALVAALCSCTDVALVGDDKYLSSSYYYI